MFFAVRTRSLPNRLLQPIALDRALAQLTVRHTSETLWVNHQNEARIAVKADVEPGL